MASWLVAKAALVLMLAYPFLAFSQAPSRDVINAASDGLRFLVKPDMESYERYGFTNPTQLTQAFLGDAFQLYFVPPDVLLADDQNRTLSSLAQPTTQWFFLVMTPEGAACMITVDYHEGRWQAISLGAAGLARQLYDVLCTWPARNAYSHRFIRIYPATSDFVVITKGRTNLGVLPLTSARISLDLQGAAFNPKQLYDFSKLLPDIRAVVRKNLGR